MATATDKLRAFIATKPTSFTFRQAVAHMRGEMDADEVRKALFSWRSQRFLDPVTIQGQAADWKPTEAGKRYFAKAPGAPTPGHTSGGTVATPMEEPKPQLLAPVACDYLALKNPAENAVNHEGTWGSIFGLPATNPLSNQPCAIWNSPDAPAKDPNYIWPDILPQALTQFRRGRNVALFGDASTGKTSFAYQLAAVLKRPITVISGDGNLEAAELIGMTVPWGEKHWQDGQLTAAIRTPGMIICLDEPSVVRPSVLFVFQNVLQNRVLTIRETGEVVKVAPGVMFMCTDNTNGRGGGNRRGYTDTNRLNAATIDRFGVWLQVNFLAAEKEAKALVGATGCTKALAEHLVKAANLTRQAAGRGEVSAGLSYRRLLSWAEQLMDGIPAKDAFNAAVYNSLSEVDQEPMKQQCSIMLDDTKIASMVRGR